MTDCIGVDLGGSGVRATRMSAAGALGEVHARALTAADDLASMWNTICGCVSACEPRGALIGVAFPAFTDAAGRVRNIVSLPALEGIDLAARLRQDVAARAVHVLPDLAAATLAEARIGAGRGYRRVLCAALGTGVNAALTVDGHVLDVALGALGDAGHVNVEAGGPPCTCGGSGCLEAICSGWALGEAARHAGFGDTTALGEAARDGNPSATAILDRAGRALGQAIATWCAMLAPDVVIIGGNLAQIGDPLLAPARATARSIGVPYLISSVPLLDAGLQGRAGLVGAGLAALEADAADFDQSPAADRG